MASQPVVPGAGITAAMPAKLTILSGETHTKAWISGGPAGRVGRLRTRATPGQWESKTTMSINGGPVAISDEHGRTRGRSSSIQIV